MGIPDAIEHGIFDWIKKGIWAKWLKFLFLEVFSATVTYLTINGSLLSGGKPELIARGFGQLAAAGAMVLCYKINGAELFKDMPAAVIPNQEVIAQLETEFHEVQPDKQEKK